MRKLIIEGGNELYGKVQISPAKNACLPIISSCLLFNGKIRLTPCPFIKDVIVMAEIIKDLGGNYAFEKGSLLLDCEKVKRSEGDCKTFKKARASFFTAGAILSRFNTATVPLPGGCNIGERPVDIHIDVFKQLGIKCNINENCVFLDGANKKSGKVYLRFPSVGATVNAINASVFLKGETVIYNCAKEPEIADLCNFLNSCGCKVKGGGNSVITVTGVKPITLNEEMVFSPMYDRIEAGTFIIAVSACGGELLLDLDNLKPISALLSILKTMGVKAFYDSGKLFVRRDERTKCVNAIADVYPRFPTDLQPQLCALQCVSEGECVMCDKVFPNRFDYTKQLELMDANVKRIKGGIKIIGVKNLNCAKVNACDLRGGAALAIGALTCSGKTVISSAETIERGYENFDKKLCSLGAFVKYV